MECIARVATDQPARYVKQLVSHLGRKRETRVDDDGLGHVLFDGGQCVLRPDTDALILVATGPDRESLASICDVVGRHLERFGRRGELQVTWSEPS